MKMTPELRQEERRRRHAAFMAFEKVYTSVHPCPKCGGLERYAGMGRCRPCTVAAASRHQRENVVSARDTNHRWRKQNLEKVRAYGRANAFRRKQAETPEQREARLARRRAGYADRRERINARRRELWAADPEAARAKRRAKRENNPESAREASKRWAAKNTHRVTAKSKARKAAKRQRTPTWLTPADHDAMARLYLEAIEVGELVGEPYHVDHIIPLQGETVSGLHVPWNLQVLRGVENVSKSNKLPMA